MAKISEQGGVTDVSFPDTMPENALAADDVGEAETDAGEDLAPEADGPVAPRVNDSKDAWVAWAQSQGWDGDPDTITKSYLVANYGG